MCYLGMSVCITWWGKKENQFPFQSYLDYSVLCSSQGIIQAEAEHSQTL